MATLKDYIANIVDLVPCLVEDAVKKLSNIMMDLTMEKQRREAKEYVLKRGSGSLFFIGADHGRYGAMKNQIKQNMAMGTNNFPKLVDKTMNILNTFAKMNKTSYGKKNN